MFNFSQGMVKALLAGDPSIDTKIQATTITAGDGDGGGSRDTLTDSGSGFGSFGIHDFILIVSGDANDGVWAKVITASASVLEVPAGTLTAVAAGSVVSILKFSPWGAMKTLYQNCTIDVYAEARPTSADDAEPGAVIASFTLNGNAFVGGTSANGLNFGYLDGTNMKRAIDPETSLVEVWRATPTATTIANSCRVYSNDKMTGASTTAIRMDGVVTTSGGDLNITQGPSLTTGVPIDVSDVVYQQRSGNVV